MKYKKTASLLLGSILLASVLAFSPSPAFGEFYCEMFNKGVSSGYSSSPALLVFVTGVTALGEHYNKGTVTYSIVVNDVEEIIGTTKIKRTVGEEKWTNYEKELVNTSNQDKTFVVKGKCKHSDGTVAFSHDTWTIKVKPQKTPSEPTTTVPEKPELQPLDNFVFDIDMNTFGEVHQGGTGQFEIKVKQIRGNEPERVRLSLTDWSSAGIESFLMKTDPFYPTTTGMIIKTTCDTKLGDYLFSVSGGSISSSATSEDRISITVKPSTICGSVQDPSGFTYNLLGGNILSWEIVKIGDNENLIFNIDVTDVGLLTTQIPREMFDSNIGTIILLDGKQAPDSSFSVSTTNIDRTLRIHIYSGANEIEIIGTGPTTPTSIITTTSTTLDCPSNYDLVSFSESTLMSSYFLDIKHGPKNPKTGCEIEWFINFKDIFDVDVFHNQVQYDIVVLDENDRMLRSIANDDGKKFLFSSSGQAHIFSTVKEDPGTSHYAIWIYGTNPQNNPPPPNELDFFKIDIQIGDKSITETKVKERVPGWIKNNAKWWSEGQIGESDFVGGIQHLIKEKIIDIPDLPEQASSTAKEKVPDWVKTNAGWWADGAIDEGTFVNGIKYLVEKGIIRI